MSIDDVGTDGMEITGVYTLTGLPACADMEKLPSGVYVVRYADGTTARVWKR